MRAFRAKRPILARRDEQEGLSIIELVIATFVLAVALLALASVALSSLTSLRITRDREQAVNAASAAIEDVRSRDFIDMAHAPGTVEVGRVPEGQLPSGSTDACIGDESVVEDDVDNPVPFETTTGNLGRITVHTIITRTQAEGDDTACTASGELKRVRAIASWTDGATGQLRRVVAQQTLAADAGRGLPVPAFELTPPERDLEFTKAVLDDALTGDDLRKCVAHELRNRGAEDSYDWELQAQVDEFNPLTAVDVYTYKISPPGDVRWAVTAFLEYREEGDDSLPNHGSDPPPTNDDRMETDVLAPSGRPTSDIRVDPAGEARFTVCYEPVLGLDLDNVLEDLPFEISTQVVVRSRFDDRVEQDVSHDIRIVDQAATGGDVPPGEEHFLFNDRIEGEPNSFDQPRQVNDNYVPDVLSLSPRPEPLATPYPDWSTDQPDDEAGVFLSRGTNYNLSANTATWHYQFGSDTNVLRDGTLRLWVSPPSSDLADPSDLGIRVKVDRLNSAENTNNPQFTVIAFDDVVPSETFASEGTVEIGGAEFWMVDIPVDLVETREFRSGRYLRLRVTCSAQDESGDCLIAYDHTSFPSALYLEYQ